MSAHRVKVSELKNLLDEIEQNPYAVNDANFDRQLNEIMETVNRLLQEAKDAMGTDDALIYELEQLKARLKKVQDTARQINSQLDFIGTNLNYGTRNVSLATNLVNSAEIDLNNARNQLEIDGRRAIAKARMRSEKYGHQSTKMSEIAREARLLADGHQNEADNIIKTYKDALNVSRTANDLANDAINTQRANKHEHNMLRNKLNEVKEQYKITDKLSGDVQKDSFKAEQDSLAFLSEIGDIRQPELHSARYKAEAINIIAQAKAAYKDASDILNKHGELLNSTGNRLKDARDLYLEAERQQQITDRLLVEADDALNQTKNAIKAGENILEDAKNTLKTLKGFDQNIQAHKERADKALKKIGQIKDDIEDAIRKTNEARESLQTALTEAIMARDIAKNAEFHAQTASADSKSIRADADQLRERLAALDEHSKHLLRLIKEISDAMKLYEDKAEEDEKLVQNALELANTAKTSALDAIRKVNGATGDIDDILNKLSEFIQI